MGKTKASKKKVIPETTENTVYQHNYLAGDCKLCGAKLVEKKRKGWRRPRWWCLACNKSAGKQ